MNAMSPRRKKVMFVCFIAVVIVTTATTVGLRSGWLVLHRTELPVGRLRPADLVTDVPAPPDFDATTKTVETAISFPRTSTAETVASAPAKPTDAPA